MAPVHEEQTMSWTRTSLFYLSAYLLIIGLGLLFVPTATLRLMLSTGSYGEVMPRLAGMLMAGLGLNIAGIIAAQEEGRYASTLAVRAFFLACLGAFYVMYRDPFFLTLGAVVLLGVVLTALSLLHDNASATSRRQSPRDA
jgi:hypothetical protein